MLGGLARSLSLLALAVGASTPAAVRAGPVFEDYRRPLPAVAGVPVTGLQVQLGHLALEFREGTAHRLITGGARHVGWYFRGSGKYVYRVEDPADRLVFEANVKAAATSLEAGPDVLHDTFSELVLLRAGVDVLGLVPPDDEAGRPGAAEIPDGFRRIWKGVELGDLEYDHYGATIDLNGPPDEYAYVEIVGDRERVGYSLDRHRSWLEFFFVFRKFQGLEYRFRQNLSRQALPGRGESPVELRLTHADLEVVTADNESGTIDSKLKLQVGRDGVQVATFGLLNNRDPNSERWQSEEKALRVLEVLGSGGKPLEFSHRYNELVVNLGRPHAVGEEVSLQVRTSGEIFTDRYGSHGDNYRELDSINWFPQPLDPAGNRFTFTLDARCKKPFKPVASGDTVFEGEQDGLNVVRTTSDIPVWSPALFLGKYKTREHRFGDLLLKVHGYGVVRNKDLDQIANVAAMFVDFYSRTLGPYPHRELDIVEIPTFSFFGVSPSGLIVLTSTSYEPASSYTSAFISNHGVNALIAHEVAHQWFGHKAWPRDFYLDNWLTESFAEYLSGLAMAAAEQQLRAEGGRVNNRMQGFKQLHAGWWRFARESRGRGTIRGANRLTGDLAGQYRVDLLYNRGPLVLHMLRSLIGEQRFFGILKAFLDEADFGPADTADLTAAASGLVGEDMGWFFTQWLDQAGIPEIEVEHRTEGADGRFALVGVVRQTGGEFFKIHIPLILEFDDGRREVRLVAQEQPEQSFRFELAARPKRVSVDPAHNNLAEYR